MLSDLLVGSELTRGESTLGSRGAQKVGCVVRRKSWVVLPPTSILVGGGMVSSMGNEVVAGRHVTGERTGTGAVVAMKDEEERPVVLGGARAECRK